MSLFVSIKDAHRIDFLAILVSTGLPITLPPLGQAFDLSPEGHSVIESSQPGLFTQGVKNVIG